MTTLKKLIVNSLAKACEIKDRAVNVTLVDWLGAKLDYRPRWFFSCDLAMLSSDLDEKWGTGQWETVKTDG